MHYVQVTSVRKILYRSSLHKKKLSNKREFHEHRLCENRSLIPDVNKFQN